jgi:hypothetical protein
MESRIKGTATKVTFADGQEFLMIEIAVDCPSCGRYLIPIAGHHLRAVRDVLIEMIDLHPDPKLTGTDAGLKILERLRFDSEPGDPRDN